MTCSRRYGASLDNVCGGRLVKLADGLLDVLYCLDCSKATLACKACGSPLARPLMKNVLRCIAPECGQSVPLGNP